MYRTWSFVSEYSLLLIGGALLALGWANVSPESYHQIIDHVLVDHFPIGHLHIGTDGESHRTLTLHYLINDVLMALFFAMAGKEVWEAITLENGSLRGRKAVTPLIATAGGMLGPVLVYLALAFVLGSDIWNATAHGWATPTATDIAFSYLVGRMVFGAGHPAVRFLLLLAIADDAGGLLILAIFYPSGELQPVWLLLSLVAAGATYGLANWLPRRMDRRKPTRPASTWVRKALGVWPYLIGGCVCWYGFQESGIHPALGLLPMVLTVPHADVSFGVFAEAETHLHDLLNEIEHGLKVPVQGVLFLFGLANAGVELTSMGDATWLVLAGLLIGKPVGITVMGLIAARGLKLGLPEGMRTVDLFVVGCVAAIGFTVALFVAAVAFDPGPVQDAAKMGALMSFAAAVVALIAGKATGVEKRIG